MLQTMDELPPRTVSSELTDVAEAKRITNKAPTWQSICCMFYPKFKLAALRAFGSVVAAEKLCCSMNIGLVRGKALS
jgi:hypothetical protein